MASTPSLAALPTRAEGVAALAAAYDRWFETGWGRHAFEVEARAVMAALGPLQDRRLLDLGCGTGRFTALAVAQGAIVTGLDIDRGMLAIARSRLPGRLAQADARCLPFSDRSFERVMAITVLEFLPDPAAAVAEMARVTVPGGRLVIGALNRASPWGLTHAVRLRRPPWSDAAFLGRRELLAIGGRHGRTGLRTVLYAPRALPGLPIVGPLLERAGRPFPAWAAFQVLTVDLDPR